VKDIFKSGDSKQARYRVTSEDVASFHGEIVHAVCSTFTIAREVEWATRQFVLEMREDHEEGVGTHISIDHKGPAFIGDEIVFTSRVETIQNHEIICSFEASVNGRIIATGKTGQKILKRDDLKRIFSRKV
jgi:fluoroacetyl-CoA thioesterase